MYDELLSVMLSVASVYRQYYASEYLFFEHGTGKRSIRGPPLWCKHLTRSPAHHASINRLT